MTRGRAPDPAAMRRWLLGPEVVDARGVVRAWAPDGHDYPEAGGLWLSWLASSQADEHRRQGDAVAAWLQRTIDAEAVGRDGIGYTFDLGVVVTGLLRWSEACRCAAHASTRRGAQLLVDAIERGVASTSVHPPSRWSTRFGAHLGKLVLALDRIDAAGLVDTDGARQRLRSVVHADADEPYVHARLYAIEGAWLHGDADVVRAGAAWLREIQRPDGAIAARWDRHRGAHGPGRSDATAQAIRLWCADDRERHAPAIDRALDHLATLQSPQGGLVYDADTPHRNVWCTLFAAQALEHVAAPSRSGNLL